VVDDASLSEGTEPKPRRRTRFKIGQFTIAPGQAFAIADTDQRTADGDQLAKPSASERKAAKHIGSVIGAYLKAGHELLGGTYSSVRDFAPAHLAAPSRVIVICCKNGVIVRYERSEDKKDHVIIAFADELAEEVAAGMYEHVIYCVPEGTQLESIDTSLSPKVQLFMQDASTGERKTFAQSRICYFCTLEEPASQPETPPGRPFRVLGVESHFELQMLAQQVDVEQPEAHGRYFIARSPIRLPVGWEHIEIYRRVDDRNWKEELAASWAESDILAHVMRRQLREQHFRALDPNVDARKEWARLLGDYTTLLQSDPPEEALQQFLTKNPMLLCPTQTRVWPKAVFGDKISDFVFREAHGDYLLVELERPSKGLFIKSGDTSNALNHAQGQITDWKRYIEDNLRTVQGELGLEGMSTNPKSLIVMGRSNTVSEEGRRKLRAMRGDNPRQNIMTYDDVLENAKAAIENILGPLWAASGSAEIYFLREGPRVAEPA
jgi:hypothetical protein